MPVSNDTKQKTKRFHINKEVVTLRGTVPGEYKVMAHVYNRGNAEHPDGGNTKNYPGWLRFSLIKITPYSEQYIEEFVYNERGQQITLLNFTLDADSKLVDSNKVRHSIITRLAGAH